MSDSLPASRFVSFAEAEVEKLPDGRTHHWFCKPGMVSETDFLFVRCHIEPGAAHSFHVHPKMEEILYILSGTAEQWVDKEKKVLKAGDSVYIAANTVHGTYNIGSDTLEFLAILTPASSEGPATVELAEQEPWKSLR